MKLIIIQLSDIHISTDKYPNNPVLTRVPKIIAALRSVFIPETEVAGCLLLVTGDIAYAGLAAEYDLARHFFKELNEALEPLFPIATHRTIFIPGNHDCNFDNDDEARRKLIEDPEPASLDDGSIVDAATTIQNAFFSFVTGFSGITDVHGLDRLFSSHTIEAEGKVILIRAFNSAWASRNPESRTLMLPLPSLTKLADPLSQTPSVVISMLHHPYNWFEPTNARALRQWLEQTSDIILTGHEHIADAFANKRLSGEQNDYIEAGVLQDNKDPTLSAFNVVVIDLSTDTQQVYQFTLSDDLYENTNEPAQQPFIRNKYRLKGQFSLSHDFEDLLNDPDAAYSHPHKDRVVLDDIYIYPDFRELDESHSKTTTTRVVHGRDLINHIVKKEHVVVTGSERSGKTALGRALFKDLLKNGKIPLLLSGREIKASHIKKMQRTLDQAFSSQYTPNLKTRYWQLSADVRAVIVDDYHKLPAIRDARDTFVRDLLQRFGVVVILAGHELRLQELVGHDRESRLLWDFNHVEILGFGHRLRAEFIKKWYRIGRAGDIEDDAALRNIIALEKTISSILGHDLLPPYPIYLLLLLQQLESNNPHDTAAASYGRLYGAVVTAYLAKSGAADELETKINYLTELAFHLYKTNRDHLTHEEQLAWHAAYCQRHLEVLDFQALREELINAQVLQQRNGELRFRYKAGFYYFVASYLADNLSNESVREEVRVLCGKLHREEAANIVVFLCHKSKDALILTEVLATANSLFAANAEGDLLQDAKFTAKLVGSVETRVLDDGDTEKNRLNALERRDKFLTSSDDDDAYEHKITEEEEEEEELSEHQLAAANMNSAIKTIQIAGQILRNFGGRLDGPEKLRLAEACYGLGMRLMKYFYTGFEKDEREIIDAVALTIRERNSAIDQSEATQIASSLVFGLLKLVTFGLFKHVSNAIGLEKLSPVFAEVLAAKPTIGRRILDLSIRLDHFAGFPVDQTLEIHREIKESLLLLEVLRQLVFNRFYFFSAPHDIKQKICQRLEIKIQPILLDTDHKRNV